MDMKIKMNIRKTFRVCLVFNFLIAGGLQSSEDKPYCELEQIPYKKQVRINDLPSYFFKINPTGEYVAYIGLEGNQLLNLKTAETYPLPGFIDPVFTPDGEHLVIPIIKQQFKGRMTSGDYSRAMVANAEKYYMAFYSFDGFKKAAKAKDTSKKTIDKLHSKPIFFDLNNNGVYQSATIPENGQFKLLSDQNGASIGTYLKKNDSVELVEKVEKLCPRNANFKTDLPMLSKDGKFVSTFNNETHTTQIFQIQADGDCHLALDLGMATGKISFNSNSSQITFHVDKFSKGFGGYFSGVASDITKEIYVLNLDKAEDQNHLITLKPTTWAKASNADKKGDGSYYPDFSKNGDVFFLSDKDNYFEFVQVEQKNLHFKSFLASLDEAPGTKENKDNKDFVNCSKIDVSPQPLYLLGQLWNHAC